MKGVHSQTCKTSSMAADIEAARLILGQSRKRRRFSHAPKLLPNQKVEVRSLEEGFQGSWHCGTVIERKNQIRVVKYEHILCDDGSDGLIESIPVLFAVDGKILPNWRPSNFHNYCGKIRPVPPCFIRNGNCLHYGMCVDVFHDHAWWEGVIFDHDDGSEERLVFFPDLGDELRAPFESIRFTLDWDAATNKWKLRGDWIFLQVLEELELEWPLLVSVKQIWYEVRNKKRFIEKMMEWTCPVRENWKETIKEVIVDNFILTMKGFFGGLNSSWDTNKCILDSMVNLAPSFFESLATVPVEEDLDDDVDLGPPGFSNLASNPDTLLTNIPADFGVCGPVIVPQAKCCPDAIVEYYQRFISGKRPLLSAASKVRQHISFLGWKIVCKTNKAATQRGSPSFYYHYIDPKGKKYYSLKDVCEELYNHSSEGNFGSFDAQTRELDVVESAYCPQAVIDYYSLALEGSSDLRRLKKDSRFREMQNRAKKHLLAVGWSKHEDISGKKMLTYSSPSGRRFPSLGHACNQYILESFCCEKTLDLRKLVKMNKDRLFGKLLNLKNDQNIQKDGILMKSRNNSNGDSLTPGHVLRSSKRARKEVSPMHQTPRTVLSWLIDNNVLLPRSKVQYRCKEDGHTKKEGRVTRDGIKCSCCQSTFSLRNFESHAGSTYQRPSASIFLEDGRSLLDCQLQLKRDQNTRLSRAKLRRVKDNRNPLENDNDYICSVCHYGGELVLCDHCPSSFHTRCVGLKEVPDGEWFCPSCCCRICNQNRFGENCEQSADSSILSCEQCEKRYHIGCLKRSKGLSKPDTNPKINWFCSPRCEEIFMGLQRLLGKPIPVGKDGLTWTLLNYKKTDDGSDTEEVAEIYSKLNVVINVMHECFDPAIEPLTRRDIVEDVIFCTRSELNRLNFKGFYTVLLEKDDELISAATLRVYGEKVAELPLVGTRFQYRRRGMCHILMNELEKKLKELGVETLVLPAVSGVLDTWTTSFGFSLMTESEKLNFLGYTFLDFQGTRMCHKLLTRGLPSMKSSISRVNGCDAINESDNIDLDGVSAVSEVSQAEKTVGGVIVDQRSPVGHCDLASTQGNRADNVSGTPSVEILPNQPTRMECQSIDFSMEEDEDQDGNNTRLQCYERRKNSSVWGFSGRKT